MKPHEQRVVAEKADLDERIAKLDAFIAAEMFKTIDAEDRGLLLAQRHYMSHYSQALALRIARFAPAGET